MNIAEAIKCLREQVKNQPKGLPEDLFHYISSATPIINVELLIKNENYGDFMQMFIVSDLVYGF